MPLDEATVTFLTQMAEGGAKPIAEVTPEEARSQTALLAEFIGAGPEMASVRDEKVQSADGSYFDVRVLVPRGGVCGLLVFYHGGGWTIGSIDGYDTLCRLLADGLGAAVVSVGYRLAPEHPYPAAVDDAWAALEWASERMTEIAGHPVPLVVMGDSAGGNLSAVVAQRARDAGGPQIDYQVLVYPVTDTDVDNASYADPENQVILTRQTMIWFLDHYVPGADDRLKTDVAPLRAASLAGLPPAIVLTAEYDVLRQEGEAYVARLREAGVPAEHRRFEGQTHGFFQLVNILPGSGEAISYVVEELGSRLAPG
jgi:acetyl esterase